MSAERIKVLRQQIAKVDLAVGNLQTAEENIGLEGFPNHPSFDLTRADLSPEQFILMAERVGDIREKIEHTSIPILERLKEALHRGVINTSADSLQRIEVHVTEGRLPQSVLEEAERRFALISGEEAKAPEASVEEVTVVEPPKQKPDVTVNFQANEIRIEDTGEVLSFDQRDFRFVALIKIGREGTVAASELKKLGTTMGFPNWWKPSGEIVSLNLLSSEKLGKELIQKEGHARWVRYSLNPEIAVAISEEAKEPSELEEPVSPSEPKGRQTIAVKLPNDEVINVVGKKLADLMNLLAGTSKGRRLKFEDLTRNVYGEWNKENYESLRSLIVVARKRFNFHNWKLISVLSGMKKRGTFSSYYIEKGEEGQKKEWPVAPHETRLRALAAICERGDEVTIDEMRDLLGPDKKGNVLTGPAIRRASEAAVNKLMVRAGKGISSEEERETLSAIELRMNVLGLAAKDWKRFRDEWLVEKIKTLKPKPRPEPEEYQAEAEVALTALPDQEVGDVGEAEIKAEAVVPEPDLVMAATKVEVPPLVKFTQYEAFLLASLLKTNPEIIQKHQLDFVDDETIERLAPAADYFRTIPPKVIKEDLERVVDQLKVLMEGDGCSLADLDANALAVVNVVMEAKNTHELIADITDASSKIKKEPFAKLTEREEDKASIKENGSGRVYSIEKTDPKARERVQSLILRIREIQLGDKSELKVVTQAFRGLKADVIRNYVRRGRVEPELLRTGVYLFTQEEVIFMAFIRKWGGNGNSISRGDLNSLRNLIREELGIAKSSR